MNYQLTKENVLSRTTIYTKTIAVIAEETGLKESTVKSKLLRGRKKLKLKMEKKGFRYEDCKIFFE